MTEPIPGRWTGRHRPLLVLPRNQYGKAHRRWLSARRAGVGASEAAAVLGLDEYATPLSLYVEKTSTASRDAGEAAYWGHQLEEIVAREWQKRNRAIGYVQRTPGLLAHPEHPWMLATVDRLIAPSRTAAADAVLEIKTTSARNDPAWREDAPPPDRVVVQVLHQLAVTGLDVGYVAALVGGQSYRQWRIDRDEDAIEHMMKIEGEFQSMVDARVPPAPIGREADGDALAALYPGDPDRTVALDEDLLPLVDECVALRARIGTLAAAREMLEQRIKAALGDATDALQPDGSLAVTWRPVTSKRIDTDALKKKYPNIAAAVTTDVTSRRFLIRKPRKEERTHAA